MACLCPPEDPCRCFSLRLKAYECESCGEEFDSNCDDDDIECPECGARRCPCCLNWYGGI